MRVRGLAAWAILIVAADGFAQPPTELPLIPVPGPEAPPAPFRPAGPVPGYDERHVYLPEPGPEFDRPQPRLDELWRVAVSGEMAWLSSSGLPRSITLTPPDVFGKAVPGVIVPTNGRSTDDFLGGFGLDVGRRVGENSGVDASVFVLPGSATRLEAFGVGTLIYSPDESRDPPVFVATPAGFGPIGTSYPAHFSTNFVGADVNFRYTLLRTQTARVDALAGYRFAYLTDELYLGERGNGEHPAYEQNRLQAETAFHGGQLGVAVGLDYGAWYTDGVVKVAYGTARTDTSASGAFRFASPAPRLGGESRGAVLPTVSWKLGVRLGDAGSVYAAYSFQYLDRVARLGDAFCGCGKPSELWVNALGLGLELRF